MANQGDSNQPQAAFKMRSPLTMFNMLTNPHCSSWMVELPDSHGHTAHQTVAYSKHPALLRHYRGGQLVHQEMGGRPTESTAVQLAMQLRALGAHETKRSLYAILCTQGNGCAMP
jgi:hypothetical protein